ncbi:MAG: DNA primase [Acidobacteriota bacterium]
MNADVKEEVRARLAIEDVVGEYVQLKRAGRNWKGLSPFSGEKTPSFFVSPDKNIWHDFSSNQGGDVFSFIMLVEGLDFRGALEFLARKAGVDLSMYDNDSQKQLAARKKKLQRIHDSAVIFYQRTLYKTESAANYVRRRGLNKMSVIDFQIGYAPTQGSVLKDFLLKKGYSLRELRDAGLVGVRGTDIFRDRLMIPLSDGQGQVIGFTGRLVGEAENAPKYLNTPQTLLYDKGRHIFGLFQAKQAIRESGFVVVVEGNLDVVSSYQAGVRQTVATAGTAMTEHHLKALARLTSDIRLAYDADKAGLAATERAIALAQRVKVELSIVSLPTGVKDPDELIQQDATLWQQAVATTRPAIEWVIDQYARRNDLATAAGKRQLTTEALQLLQAVADPVEREHYVDMLSKLTGASREAVAQRLAQLDNGETEVPRRLKAVKTTELADAREQMQQDYLLALMTVDDGAVDVAAKDLRAEYFDGMERQALFTYLTSKRNHELEKTIPEDLHDIETYVKIVLLKAETRYVSLDGQDRLVEAVSLVRQVKQQHRTRQKQQLTESLRDAEALHNDGESARLRAALNALIKEE